MIFEVNLETIKWHGIFPPIAPCLSSGMEDARHAFIQLHNLVEAEAEDFGAGDLASTRLMGPETEVRRRSVVVKEDLDARTGDITDDTAGETASLNDEEQVSRRL